MTEGRATSNVNTCACIARGEEEEEEEKTGRLRETYPGQELTQAYSQDSVDVRTVRITGLDRSFVQPGRACRMQWTADAF